MTSIADSPTPILQYDFDDSRSVLVYTAQKAPDSTAFSRLRRRGGAVRDESIWSLLAASPNELAWMGGSETFVVSGLGHKTVRRRVAEPGERANIEPELLKVSPNGRYAMAIGSAPEAPADWDLYTEHIFKDSYLPAARMHPEAHNAIRQYQVIDLSRAESRLLWNAPANPYGDLVWSPDSLSVAIGPTFLPASSSDAEGLDGRAVVVIDLKSGDFERLRIPRDSNRRAYRPVRWNKDGAIELGYADFWKEGNVDLIFKKTAGEWQQVAEARPATHPAQVRIELRQDPNTPPRLVALDVKSGQERVILDINPELKGRELGRVETVHWTARDGKPWSGMLYYPVHFSSTRKFPLVIQTHGYSANEFSLEGSGILTTAYAARPLASVDIAVLQVGGPDSKQWWEHDGTTPREPEASMFGYLGAIDHLASIGIVDEKKIGLLGFSRTGWHVEYALTHSNFPFAAAIVADNINPGFFDYVINQDAYRSEMEADLGAAPFGKGLEPFMRQAPDFNVSNIETPIRIELDSGPIAMVLAKWEMFSLLKHLNKPVELFIIPDIRHGTHFLQNPTQRLASEGGAVDWFAFWLKEEEDPDPTKREQYARWRALRDQQAKARETSSAEGH